MNEKEYKSMFKELQDEYTLTVKNCLFLAKSRAFMV